jgi:hypothetical protein
LTTYRVRKELDDGDMQDVAEAEQAPQIGLAQVFSPGAFLTVGIFRLPIVLGGGVSMSPELRRITDTGGNDRNATALRIMGFIAFDVTLYQFR